MIFSKSFKLQKKKYKGKVRNDEKKEKKILKGIDQFFYSQFYFSRFFRISFFALRDKRDL